MPSWYVWEKFYLYFLQFFPSLWFVTIQSELWVVDIIVDDDVLKKTGTSFKRLQNYERLKLS
jgi:hypothetical protein